MNVSDITERIKRLPKPVLIGGIAVVALLIFITLRKKGGGSAAVASTGAASDGTVGAGGGGGGDTPPDVGQQVTDLAASIAQNSAADAAFRDQITAALAQGAPSAIPSPKPLPVSGGTPRPSTRPPIPTGSATKALPGSVTGLRPPVIASVTKPAPVMTGTTAHPGKAADDLVLAIKKPVARFAGVVRRGPRPGTVKPAASTRTTFKTKAGIYQS